MEGGARRQEVAGVEPEAAERVPRDAEQVSGDGGSEVVGICASSYGWVEEVATRDSQAAMAGGVAGELVVVGVEEEANMAIWRLFGSEPRHKLSDASSEDATAKMASARTRDAGVGRRRRWAGAGRRYRGATSGGWVRPGALVLANESARAFEIIDRQRPPPTGSRRRSRLLQRVHRRPHPRARRATRAPPTPPSPPPPPPQPPSLCAAGRRAASSLRATWTPTRCV